MDKERKRLAFVEETFFLQLLTVFQHLFIVFPNSWVNLQGSCYKFSSKALNWNAAKSACKALGSDLVVINSQTELQALTSKVSQTVWIGMHRDPPRTSLAGCGLTDHVQRTLTGILENLTVFTRSVQKCILRYMDVSGMTSHAHLHACTFVKPEVYLTNLSFQWLPFKFFLHIRGKQHS